MGGEAENDKHQVMVTMLQKKGKEADWKIATILTDIINYAVNLEYKIEVKVNIHYHKCKSNILKSSLNFKISVDSEKGILTIIGNVDPVLVATQARKTRKVADLIGVGPPKAKEKRPDPPKSEPAISHLVLFDLLSGVWLHGLGFQGLK
ncbi:hypothetical protein TEA_020192 [Camellia sinensis var. sinensis]|uniref:HMA domain-containing protein n=1 Tax=Camellia sinensis var. sinensis TaxID=542762 RepID=A0A4S4DGF5_CAMSN|nr:hypothetical protein TEA_020192 [Camellia sinensis var. sinensis]